MTKRHPWTRALAFVAILVALAPATAVAQDAPAGLITGTVTNGTQGSTLSDDLQVNLIVLDADGIAETRDAELDAGAFEFAVEPDPALRYVLRANYQGVDYLADPVVLSPAEPSAERPFTVFETTTEAPALSIDSTVVTAVGLDRAAGELTLLREDTVRNESDRVYVGDGDSGTLRIPAPAGTLEASGLSEFASVRLEGQVVVTDLPLRPGLTPVGTVIRVGYDPVDDRYRLRVTAPLPTAYAAARVPDAFVREVEALGAAERADDAEFDGETLLVVEQPAALREGEALLVEWRGLASSVDSNPLTESPALGAGLALLVLLGAAAGVAWWRRERTEGSPG